MLSQDKTSVRHPVEAALLDKALEGNEEAINQVFLYLSSTDPHTHQIIQETIHDNNSQGFWKKLLRCLAIQRWDGHRDSDGCVDQEISQRIDQAIEEIFVTDEHDWETTIKDNILQDALRASQAEFRFAAAYLRGLRGDSEMIPILEEILDSAEKSWKVRAVRSLAAIGDERCGMPLIRALAMDRGALHSEAKQALKKLGPLAVRGWGEAINHPDRHVRLSAIRGLGETAEANSVDILAAGLLDECQEVRWVTAGILAWIGAPAVPSTLKVIRDNELKSPSRQVAFHSLHSVVSRRLRVRLKPILEALENPAAIVEASSIAQHLLQEWEKDF